MTERWFWEYLNGGCPIEDASRLPADWHEIKAWAEEVLRPAG